MHKTCTNKIITNSFHVFSVRWIWQDFTKIPLETEQDTACVIEVPGVTDVKFLLRKPIHRQEKTLWELKVVTKEKCVHPFIKFSQLIHQGMYGGQFGEFESGYWGLWG